MRRLSWEIVDSNTAKRAERFAVILDLVPRTGDVGLTLVSGHRRPDCLGPISAMNRHGLDHHASGEL